MTQMTRVTALTVAVVLLGSVAAFAQGASKPDCPPPAASPGTEPRATSPQTIQGEVVDVDQQRGRVTLRGSDGKTYEFQASQETLADMKRGDRIEARLRSAPGC